MLDLREIKVLIAIKISIYYNVRGRRIEKK
jgi:hypothetical protein